MVTIRKATPADAPGIALVHVDSWRTTYKGIVADEFLQSLSVEHRAQAWAEILANPEHPAFLFVAENEGEEIMGFVSGRTERDHDAEYTGEVGAIYLLKQAQGQGTGRRMMQAAARELMQRGHLSMLLWVLKDNFPARKFYEALGGKYLREKPIQIGEQSLIEVAYGWNDLNTLAKE
ncbi:MAG: GNAT family N-acetyltransferase [Chloroflexota bacterium]